MSSYKLRKPRAQRQPSVLMERLRELMRWLAEPLPSKEHSDDWYAGSCVEPVRFSEQLARLQESLSKPVHETAPKVPVRQR